MSIFSKALFIDFTSDEIEPRYLDRMKQLFSSAEFLPRNNPEINTVIQDADAIFVKIATPVDKTLIDAALKLKYIGVQSTAFDAIDAVYAREKGIVVCNLGGYSTEAVSEFFFAALFEYARELERAKLQARGEDYSFDKFLGLELKGKTLGVIGAGKIGGRIAEIGLGIGLKVVYLARNNKPSLDERGAKQVELDELLKQSDFVSLNLILNKETEGIMNNEKIALLKQGCVFINLAPPRLIDQIAMMKKASNGEITFIFDHSDDIAPELAKQFLETKNCIVYPPTAFRTYEANTARFETFVSNIENFAAGNPQNVVNSA